MPLQYGLEPEVAKHLSSSYGSQAWTLLSLSPSLSPQTQTSALDPHRSLSVPYPFTHSEITYALTHEYAQKPLDVLLRRTRLGFVDARAALGALPEVVRVMGDALGWDVRRRQEEARRGEEVLRGMDAGGRVEIGSGAGTAATSVGAGWWMGEFRRRLCSVFGCATPASVRSVSVAATYPRALFEPGEIDALREVFGQLACIPSDSGSDSGSGSVEQQQQLKIPVSRLREAIQTVAGLGYAYDSVRESDFRYILREAGLSDSPEGSGKGKKRNELDFEEFIEVLSILHFLVFVQMLTLGYS